MDNLLKDFDPKSCLFSFKYDEQTGKICSAITVEHYDDKGSCDKAWFLDKELLNMENILLRGNGLSLRLKVKKKLMPGVKV